MRRSNHRHRRARLGLVVGLALAGPAANLVHARPSQPPPGHAPSSQKSIPSASHARTLVPGAGIGPLSLSNTRADVLAAFGRANVSDEDIQNEAGDPEPASRVLPGSHEELIVFWSRREMTADRYEIRGSAWRLPEGIGVGSTLQEVEAAIGPFTLTGFGGEDEGLIDPHGTRLAPYQGLLALTLEPVDGIAGTSGADLAAVTGNKPFASTNPHVRALRLVVGRLVLFPTPRARLEPAVVRGLEGGFAPVESIEEWLYRLRELPIVVRLDKSLSTSAGTYAGTRTMGVGGFSSGDPVEEVIVDSNDERVVETARTVGEEGATNPKGARRSLTRRTVVLRFPVTEGRSWRSSEHERRSIRRVGIEWSSSAATYAGCAEVEIETRTPKMQAVDLATEIWCPGVGKVKGALGEVLVSIRRRPHGGGAP